MREHRPLLAIAAVAVVAVLAGLLLLMMKGGGSTTAQQPAPVPTEVVPQTTAEPDSAEELDAASGSVTVQQPTSNRDPFAPVVKPTDQASEDSGGSSDVKTSSDPVTKDQPKSSVKSGTQQQQAAASEQKSSKQKDTKNSDTKKESKGKAPVPVGGGDKDSEESDGSDVAVVDVRQAIAIVRINDVRTTLYLGVPDTTGVTFNSPLGGGCGLFSKGGSPDLFTICKGETRQL